MPTEANKLPSIPALVRFGVRATVTALAAQAAHGRQLTQATGPSTQLDVFARGPVAARAAAAVAAAIPGAASPAAAPAGVPTPAAFDAPRKARLDAQVTIIRQIDFQQHVGVFGVSPQTASGYRRDFLGAMDSALNEMSAGLQSLGRDEPDTRLAKAMLQTYLRPQLGQKTFAAVVSVLGNYGRPWDAPQKLICSAQGYCVASANNGFEAGQSGRRRLQGGLCGMGVGEEC